MFGSKIQTQWISRRSKVGEIDYSLLAKRHQRPIGQEELKLQVLETSNEDLWKAVQRRDYRYSNSFVFGVKSTKIYCRPSCPARTTQREQIVYFFDSAGAEEAGFRACERCRPREEGFITLQKRRIEDACNYMDRNLNNGLNLEDLGKRSGLNPCHFQRIFKRFVGITPRQYAEASRVRQMKLALRRGESVRRAIYNSGRNSTSWLYTNPLAKLGMIPSTYKNKGRGLQINYSIKNCRLGKLLVAGTDRGICAVRMGDSEKILEALLMSEYQSAHIQREDSDQLAIWVERILKYLDGDNVILLDALPLDIQATSFQYKVWKELQSIPYGATRSYSEIAKKLSKPKGSRAVASACAKNPVSLVIPCHRVIRKNGSLGGYASGLSRKASLLHEEKRNLLQGTELGH